MNNTRIELWYRVPTILRKESTNFHSPYLRSRLLSDPSLVAMQNYYVIETRHKCFLKLRLTGSPVPGHGKSSVALVVCIFCIQSSVSRLREEGDAITWIDVVWLPGLVFNFARPKFTT